MFLSKIVVKLSIKKSKYQYQNVNNRAIKLHTCILTVYACKIYFDLFDAQLHNYVVACDLIDFFKNHFHSGLDL